MRELVLAAPLAGWVRALETVPDAVFAERMVGDGLAIDPTGDCLHAPCAATVIALQPTGHAITLRAEGGAELIIHIGLDTVALGGRGFIPCVAAGDRVAPGDPLIRFDLDLLVREARAVVTPFLLAGEGFAIVERAGVGLIAAGEPLMRIAPVTGAATALDADAGADATRTLAIDLPHGIHARPAARIAALARTLPGAPAISKGTRSAPASSPTGLLTLGVRHGDSVTISASGPDAATTVAALATLIERGLDEPPAPARPSAAAAPPSPPRDVPAGALAGVTAAAGIAIGPIHHHRAADLDVPATGAGAAREEAAFHAAHRALAATLAARARHATGAARAIADAHGAMLDDPALVAATQAGIARGESAGYAWRAAIRPQADALRDSGDTRLAERADDMLDLERQLIAELAGGGTAPPPPRGAVLVADDLLPSDLAGIEPGWLAALCIARGGPTSHVAILAGAMGLPALVALGPALTALADGAEVIVDADAGLVHPDPGPERLAEARAAIAAAARRQADALARAGEDCCTADGTRIEIFANLGARAEAAGAVAAGAEGCGLLRTEFLFLERDTAPTTAEQAEEYQAIADALDGRPLIVRLLDIGGDKPAPYLSFPPEDNPALGLRGIRVGLADPAILDAQLAAILAVRPAGRCRIMVPMVATIGELRAVRARLDRLRGEAGHAAPVELGIMVETPAAAVTADLLAAEADFLSIGTNDLTQYALAMDRGNAAVAAAIDGLHPAVLRLIAQTCAGGAAHGRWTGVCGGLASDPLAVPILLGLGVTELSATPAMVAEIKALVRGLALDDCRRHARAALACADAAEVRTLARRFAAEGELR